MYIDRPKFGLVHVHGQGRIVGHTSRLYLPAYIDFLPIDLNIMSWKLYNYDIMIDYTNKYLIYSLQRGTPNKYS
jgi:hypothetical protein